MINDNREIYLIFNGGRTQEESDDVMGCVLSVERSLRNCGYDVIKLSLNGSMEEVAEKLRGLSGKVVFNLFEGLYDDPQTEWISAEIMERFSVCFTGNSSYTLRTTLNKEKTKELFRQNNISTPDSQLVVSPDFVFELSFPCIVKPNCEDASWGLSIVFSEEGLRQRVKQLLMEVPEILLEVFVEGREFNVSVMGNNELKIVEISEIIFEFPPDVPKILSYDSKWNSNSEFYRRAYPICPAPVDADLRRMISEMSIKACNIVGCNGYARVDFRQSSSNGCLYILEVNANPDISEDAGFALQSRMSGLTYDLMIESIVDLALKKHGGKK